MDRLLTNELIRWRSQPNRKPILVDGARQVGKSYLIGHLFGEFHFSKVHTLDFSLEPGLADLFAEGLNPEQIVANLEIRRNLRIDIEHDLIFFDEIGECQAAVDSLKYFSESLPEAYVCASGSSIGLLESFPVGKVEFLELFPMTFEEFVMAAGNERLLNAYRSRAKALQVQEMLLDLLLDYFFVGGMPEAVKAWIEKSGRLLDRCDRVKNVHHALINGYLRDFGKYSGKVHASHLESVFRNIPRQLSRTLDSSVQRYSFKDVVERKRRYVELRGPIDWLDKAKLASKCFPLNCRPIPPLAALAKENMFKLFLFDLGLLGHLLDLSYAEHRSGATYLKGFIAENFVQNELYARGIYPTYSWAQARSEIEFLHKCRNGEIVPVEVKSGRRTRAKSLASYVQRYSPQCTLKLIGASVPRDEEAAQMVWPLYDAAFVADL